MKWLCKMCGSAVEEGMKFCGSCGARYIKKDNLFRFNQQSPLAITEQALFTDENKQAYLSLTMQNISKDVIAAAYLSADCYGVAGEELAPLVDYVYIDLHVSPEEYFGSSEVIKLPDPNTRKADVYFSKVVTESGTVLEINDKEYSVDPSREGGTGQDFDYESIIAEYKAVIDNSNKEDTIIAASEKILKINGEDYRGIVGLLKAEQMRFMQVYEEWKTASLEFIVPSILGVKFAELSINLAEKNTAIPLLIQKMNDSFSRKSDDDTTKNQQITEIAFCVISELVNDVRDTLSSAESVDVSALGVTLVNLTSSREVALWSYAILCASDATLIKRNIPPQCLEGMQEPLQKIYKTYREAAVILKARYFQMKRLQVLKDIYFSDSSDYPFDSFVNNLNYFK